MHTFIALLNFTDQGIQHLRDSPHRADTFMEVAEIDWPEFQSVLDRIS